MGALPSGMPDRRHVSAKTQSAVAAKVRGLERQRDTGAVTSSGRVTVDAYLAEWIVRKERMGSVRPLTLPGYRTDESHIAAAIGRVRLDRLGPANVEYLWSSMLDQGLSVAHCRRTLNAALNDAVKRRVMAATRFGSPRRRTSGRRRSSRTPSRRWARCFVLRGAAATRLAGR